MATKYYQLEYVNQFHCDGQKCSAKCCKGWNVFVDKNTYKKYSRLKPKSEAQEITRHMTKIDRGGMEKYVIKHTENGSCPFLTEDKFCDIQKKYDEDFLPKVCFTYPRNVYDFKDFLEVSLSLSCPVAAELILLSTGSLKLEEVELPEKSYNKISVEFDDLPKIFTQKVVKIHETAIAILQERNFTIDQRLMLLGFYCEKLNELLTNNRIFEINKVNANYQNSEFLQEQFKEKSTQIKFKPREYILTILGLLESLYGTKSGNVPTEEDKKILDAIIATLKLEVDENHQVNIDKLAQNYVDLNEERKNFVDKFSTIFENYLVNEFFTNLYPFKFAGGVSFNYGVFVTIYKMLELATFSMAKQNNSTEQDLIHQISRYAQNTDHNPNYIGKILEHLKNKKSDAGILQSLLQKNIVRMTQNILQV